MKITLDIPNNTMCAFLNCIEYTSEGLSMRSYSLDGDDMRDGNIIKLPRNQGEEGDAEK